MHLAHLLRGQTRFLGLGGERRRLRLRARCGRDGIRGSQSVRFGRIGQPSTASTTTRDRFGRIGH